MRHIEYCEYSFKMGKIKVEVRKINHGIACRIGNKVFINNRLTENPKLYEAILKHELSHTSGFVWKDVVLDAQNKELQGLKQEYYKFVISNPSSWTELLPFLWYEGKFVFNPMISFIYLISLILARFIAIRII